MKKTLIYSCLLALFAVPFVACDEAGMDEVSAGGQTKEEVYSDVTKTRGVLYDLYGRQRRQTANNQGSFARLSNMAANLAMLDNATDDGSGNIGRVVMGIQKHLNAAITATTNPTDLPEHPWTWYYNAIRCANEFLVNVDSSPLDAAEKARSKCEAIYLRAFYYQELFRMFGGLVIYEEAGDPFAFATTKREDVATTVRWIEAQFNDVISGEHALPNNTDYALSDFGRATRGAAMAFKARLLLYAASPLHAAKSGVTWAEAAQAALECIQHGDAGHYALYVDTDDASMSYKRLFNTRYNSEIMAVYLRADANDLYNVMPATNPWNVNKELATAGTQWMIDCYDMKDGKEPIDINQYGPGPTYTPHINTGSGYDEQNPYANRDPRLDQTWMHDGTIWPKVNKVANVKVDYATLNSSGSWGAGYFLCKFLDPKIDHMNGDVTTQNFIMMRYAEVLLNYAEAINEAENSASAREKAVTQLNRIRTRAGITTPLVASDYTQSTLRDRIHKERRVELCFEEHRFFDIRRWKIATTVMKRPATGIIKTGGVYQRVALDTRYYNERMDLMPIVNTDAKNCPLVYQNPGY